MRAMSLGARLNLGVAVSLLLIFAVSAAAWWITLEFEQEVTQEDVSFMRRATRLAEAESALWQLRQGFPEFMVGDAEAQRQILDAESKWSAVIDAVLSNYATGRLDSEALIALTQLRAEYQRYHEARPRFFELWQAGRRQDATDWRALATTPYGTATVKALDHLNDIERALWQREQIEATRNVALAKLLVSGISLSLLVLLAMGYVAARKQLRPLVELRERAVRSVHAVLGDELETGGGNEVIALVQTVDAMTQRFTEHASLLSRSREELLREAETLEEAVASRTETLAQTVDRMERQNRAITLRNELGDLLQSCIGIDEAGAVIARFAPKLFPASAGAAYLATPGADTLVAVTHWGETAEAETLASSDCWALRRGKTHLVIESDATLLCPHVTAPLSGASLCLPLSAHGEALGLLHLICLDLCGPDAVARAETETLAEAVAAQVGMALANLRLRESLHQQSIRDALTGLYNRRYLEGTLPRELARAQRGGRPLAVIMLDVDHFKNFNDSFGHEAGDAVLRALGRTLRESCRQADIACRFGGEEFTLILPDADEHAAREWSERLMSRVRSTELKAAGQTLPRVTVSLGLAVFPTHGNDTETLLQAADLALYDAKHAGRDRLAVSGESAHD